MTLLLEISKNFVELPSAVTLAQEFFEWVVILVTVIYLRCECVKLYFDNFCNSLKRTEKRLYASSEFHPLLGATYWLITMLNLLPHRSTSKKRLGSRHIPQILPSHAQSRLLTQALTRVVTNSKIALETSTSQLHVAVSTYIAPIPAALANAIDSYFLLFSSLAVLLEIQCYK